ncbi:uncharacterized protein C8Q71DRAFT_722022 [Rhodofomes roseus]|uniref:CxC2-like cysteine cluster KDZ transposase-associated domain-containing protein n=1 Tax=Rhodofomes roseus TaxID=34475 RepID=A0ABQ8KRH9_9APHY|nr:uncharacterized protein C8Q71DRAFT_722022 [Rhodofomes roseus]KAH9840335.1 hypothetical protein C8Q71DRAFT_722022 [Rhodofomes roseus]
MSGSGKPHKLPRKWQVLGSTQRLKFVRPVATKTRRGVDYKMVEISRADGNQPLIHPPPIGDLPSHDPRDPMDPRNHIDVADLVGIHGPLPKRPKDSGSTQADFMDAWLALRESFLERLIELEGPREKRNCADCRAEWSPWRCIECVGSPSLCTDCCRRRHAASYLHPIEKWIAQEADEANVRFFSDTDGNDNSDDGEAADPIQQGPIESEEGYYAPSSLYDVGIRVFLGHFGQSCPLVAMYGGTQPYLRECCRELLSALRRLSNPAFPQAVPDRYRELLRVSRQWRNLKYRKWNGFGHERGPVGPGELALGCVACPMPGVNLKAGWEQDPDRWKFMQTFVMDGNFSAEHLKMRCPADDVAIGDGHGFMVTDAPYKNHLPGHIGTTRAVTLIVPSIKPMPTAMTWKLQALAQLPVGDMVASSLMRWWISRRGNGIQTFLIMYDIACQYSKKVLARFAQGAHLSWPEAADIFWGIGLFHIHGHQRDCLPKYSPSFIPGAGQVDGEIIETLWAPLNRISGSTRAMATSHRKEVIDDHMNDANWRKTIGMVKMLSRRFIQAEKQQELCQELLQELEESSDAELLAKWKELEMRARMERGRDLSVMESYEVTQEKAPGKKQMQLLLEQEEGKQKDSPGSTSWLAEGILIQEQQLAVSALARKLKKHALLADRLQLVEKRNKLKRAVDRFSSKAAGYWKQEDDEEADDEAARHPGAYAGEEWEDLEEEPDLGEDRIVMDEPEDEILPESISLLLPSTLGKVRLEELGKVEMGRRELRLREGQANDALHRLRMALGMKSVLFRTKVRLANSQRTKTRAYKDVSGVTKVITECARLYTLARTGMTRVLMGDAEAAKMEKQFKDYHKAMGRDSSQQKGVGSSGQPSQPNSSAQVEAKQVFREWLKTLPPQLQRYRPLTKEDLKTTTHLLDHTERKSRHKELSWIWAVDVGGDTESSEWLTELHRVNWLREKAKCDRWREQLVLVGEEMQQTARSFEFKARQWKMRCHGSSGHQAYARRQAALWLSLAADARAAYTKLAT